MYIVYRVIIANLTNVSVYIEFVSGSKMFRF